MQLYVKLPLCIGLSGFRSEQESHKEAQVSPRNVVLGLLSCLLCHPGYVHKFSVVSHNFASMCCTVLLQCLHKFEQKLQSLSSL